MTVTCTTEGCVNNGIPIDVTDDVPAYCGPCGAHLNPEEKS